MAGRCWLGSIRWQVSGKAGLVPDSDPYQAATRTEAASNVVSLMRNLLIVLLLSACAWAQSPTPGGQPAQSKANPNSPQDVNAQKARTLLDQCIAALGGQAWLTAKDMTQEGRSYGYNNGSPTGMGTLFW